MLRILDPVGESRVAAVRSVTPAVNALDGKVIGFLVNDKGEALTADFEGYTYLMEERLRRMFPNATFVREIKPNLTKVAPAEMIDRLARSADIVINGLGK